MDHFGVVVSVVVVACVLWLANEHYPAWRLLLIGRYLPNARDKPSGEQTAVVEEKAGRVDGGTCWEKGFANPRMEACRL